MAAKEDHGGQQDKGRGEGGKAGHSGTEKEEIWGQDIEQGGEQEDKGENSPEDRNIPGKS